MCPPLGLGVSETSQHLRSNRNVPNNSPRELLISHVFQVKKSEIKSRIGHHGSSLLTGLVNTELHKGALRSLHRDEGD